MEQENKKVEVKKVDSVEEYISRNELKHEDIEKMITVPFKVTAERNKKRKSINYKVKILIAKDQQRGIIQTLNLFITQGTYNLFCLQNNLSGKETFELNGKIRFTTGISAKAGNEVNVYELFYADKYFCSNYLKNEELEVIKILRPDVNFIKRETVDDSGIVLDTDY